MVTSGGFHEKIRLIKAVTRFHSGSHTHWFLWFINWLCEDLKVRKNTKNAKRRPFDLIFQLHFIQFTKCSPICIFLGTVICWTISMKQAVLHILILFAFWALSGAFTKNVSSLFDYSLCLLLVIEGGGCWESANQGNNWCQQSVSECVWRGSSITRWAIKTEVFELSQGSNICQQMFQSKTPAKHRYIFCYKKCNASSRVRTHDLLPGRHSH